MNPKYVPQPTYELWMAAYSNGDLNSETKIMIFSLFQEAFIAKKTCESLLKALYDDYHIMEIRLNDGDKDV